MKLLTGPTFEHPFGLMGVWLHVAQDTDTKKLEDKVWLRFWAKGVLQLKDGHDPHDN